MNAPHTEKSSAREDAPRVLFAARHPISNLLGELRAAQAVTKTIGSSLRVLVVVETEPSNSTAREQWSSERRCLTENLAAEFATAWADVHRIANASGFKADDFAVDSATDFAACVRSTAAKSDCKLVILPASLLASSHAHATRDELRGEGVSLTFVDAAPSKDAIPGQSFRP